jgi:hypothetical protein
MAELTLTQVFGAGATQNATTLTIAKADLTGLIASENNTADSLVAGLIVLLQSTLTQSAFDLNVDQSIYVSEGFASFVTRGDGNNSYRIDQRIFNLTKPDAGTTLNPNDY